MKTGLFIRLASLYWILIIQVLPLTSQDILLDEPIKAGELTLFPSLSDKKKFYYLTDKPKLGTTVDGKPQFSFLRYVENSISSGIEGDGGGIVHAVIVLEVTDAQRRDAQKALQQLRPEANIEGPAIFSGGTIALISSIAKPNGEFAKEVLGLGTAPLLDGHKAAISVLLTKPGAKILWESFKTPTPDMSISFEMTLKGYRSPKRVIIEADFDKVYSNTTMQLAAAVHGPVLLGAEISSAFEELIESKAIKVTQIGTDENLEKALETAYNKLTSLMFDPSGGTGTPSLAQLTSVSGSGNGSLLDKATASLSTERDKATKRNDEIRTTERTAASERDRLSKEIVTAEEVAPPPKPASTGEDKSLRDDVVIGPKTINRDRQTSRPVNDVDENATPKEVVPVASVLASYQMKKVHQKGTFRIDLNKYTADNLVLRFDENFGKINCAECFHEANLESPLYMQREIYSYLDGFSSQDFGKYLNFVNVTVRKQHQDGDVTDREIRIDKKNFNDEGNNFKMVYGYKGDQDRLEWLNYDYKVVWSYFGGFTMENDWTSSTIGTIPLSSPFIRKTIDVEASPDNFAQNNVRTCEIKITFMLGSQEQIKVLRLTPATNQLSAQVEILMPPNKLDYMYELTWFLADGSSKNSGKLKGGNSIIFADFK